jgi:hypothetical protein
MRLSRRSRYLALGVGLFVLGSVVFNLGFSTTRADRAADLRVLVSHVASDVASCNSSVRDSLTAYTEVVAGHPSERSSAEKVVAGDEPYCTPVGNTDLYDLETLEVPGSLKAYNLQPALQDLSQWAYPTGATAMTDVGVLLAHPEDAAARTDLQSRLMRMRALDASAESAFSRAGTALGTSVQNIDLGAADRLGSANL